MLEIIGTEQQIDCLTTDFYRSYEERINSVLFYSHVNILHGICLHTHLLCVGISFSIPRAKSPEGVIDQGHERRRQSRR